MGILFQKANGTGVQTMKDLEVVNYYTTKDGHLFMKGATQRKFLDHYRSDGFELIIGDPPIDLLPPPIPVFDTPVREKGYPPIQAQLNWLWEAMNSGALPKDNVFFDNLSPYIKPRSIIEPVVITGSDLSKHSHAPKQKELKKDTDS